MTTGAECQMFCSAASDYLDGVVTGHNRVALDQHLDGCRQCARFLDEM